MRLQCQMQEQLIFLVRITCVEVQLIVRYISSNDSKSTVICERVKPRYDALERAESRFPRLSLNRNLLTMV